MICIETHCHSHHSFDCNTAIGDIISTCEHRGIKGIVICDHDVCGITPDEERLFDEHGIKLFKAIEFTTKTDAHVIGISPSIKELEKPRFYYELGELIQRLQAIDATIIIPHPNHGTGIIGNGKIPSDIIDKAFKAAHFAEIENYRYGKTRTNLSDKYTHLRFVIGSDAHSSKSVGSYVNRVNAIKESLRLTLDQEIQHVKNAEHGRSYWLMKTIKRTSLYQMIINIMPANVRREIKNMLINK